MSDDRIRASRRRRRRAEWSELQSVPSPVSVSVEVDAAGDVGRAGVVVSWLCTRRSKSVYVGLRAWEWLWVVRAGAGEEGAVVDREGRCRLRFEVELEVERECECECECEEEESGYGGEEGRLWAPVVLVEVVWVGRFSLAKNELVNTSAKAGEASISYRMVRGANDGWMGRVDESGSDSIAKHRGVIISLVLGTGTARCVCVCV